MRRSKEVVIYGAGGVGQSILPNVKEKYGSLRNSGETPRKLDLILEFLGEPMKGETSIIN